MKWDQDHEGVLRVLVDRRELVDVAVWGGSDGQGERMEAETQALRERVLRLLEASEEGGALHRVSILLDERIRETCARSYSDDVALIYAADALRKLVGRW